MLVDVEPGLSETAIVGRCEGATTQARERVDRDALVRTLGDQRNRAVSACPAATHRDPDAAVRDGASPYFGGARVRGDGRVAVDGVEEGRRLVPRLPLLLESGAIDAEIARVARDELLAGEVRHRAGRGIFVAYLADAETRGSAGEDAGERRRQRGESAALLHQHRGDERREVRREFVQHLREVRRHFRRQRAGHEDDTIEGLFERQRRWRARARRVDEKHVTVRVGGKTGHVRERGAEVGKPQRRRRALLDEVVSLPHEERGRVTDGVDRDRSSGVARHRGGDEMRQRLDDVGVERIGGNPDRLASTQPRHTRSIHGNSSTTSGKPAKFIARVTWAGSRSMMSLSSA